MLARLLDRLTGRRVRQLEAEVANLTAELETALKRADDYFAINEGIQDKLRALAVPLPGEERVEERRVLN